MDGCGRTWTRLGDLLTHKVGVRAVPGVPTKPLHMWGLRCWVGAARTLENGILFALITRGRFQAPRRGSERLAGLEKREQLGRGPPVADAHQPVLRRSDDGAQLAFCPACAEASEVENPRSRPNLVDAVPQADNA